MTPYVIDKNSWHYKTMLKFNSYSLWRCQDICAYVRAVLITILLLGLTAATIGGFIALVFGDTIAWVAACFMMGTIVDVGIGPIVLMLLTSISVIFVGYYRVDTWMKDRSYDDPGAVKLAYMSWKDKYCAKITFDYVQKQ